MWKEIIFNECEVILRAKTSQNCGITCFRLKLHFQENRLWTCFVKNCLGNDFANSIFSKTRKCRIKKFSFYISDLLFSARGEMFLSSPEFSWIQVYLVDFQARVSRKRNLEWKNFTPCFRLFFSRETKCASLQGNSHSYCIRNTLYIL